MLHEIQTNLYEKAFAFRQNHTWQTKTYDELKEAVAQGVALAYWRGNHECETSIKEETKATNRSITLSQESNNASTSCVYCGKSANEQALFGTLY